MMLFKFKTSFGVLRADARMSRMMLGDLLCFIVHRHVYLGNGEAECLRCGRWWQDDYVTSRYINRYLVDSVDSDPMEVAHVAIDDVGGGI